MIHYNYDEPWSCHETSCNFIMDRGDNCLTLSDMPCISTKMELASGRIYVANAVICWCVHQDIDGNPAVITSGNRLLPSIPCNRCNRIVPLYIHIIYIDVFIKFSFNPSISIYLDFPDFPASPSSLRSRFARRSTETLLIAIIGQLALKFSFSNIIEAQRRRVIRVFSDSENLEVST